MQVGASSTHLKPLKQFESVAYKKHLLICLKLKRVAKFRWRSARCQTIISVEVALSEMVCIDVSVSWFGLVCLFLPHGVGHTCLYCILFFFHYH